MDPRFPAIEPYDSGMLDVGDGHQVYWECCGNPNGRPALFLHGGPGSGCSANQRRFFDPTRYRIVLFDQRGRGRSRPSAGTPGADLSSNTTGHLIADIELLREHLGIRRWTILGLSWGTTLGLAYAQTNPDHVDAMVLGLVTTTSRREVRWVTYDVGRIFPQEWDRFAAAVPAEMRDLPLVDAYAASSSIPIRLCGSVLRRSGVGGKIRTSPLLPATRLTGGSRIRNFACGSPAWLRITGGTPRSSKMNS